MTLVPPADHDHLPKKEQVLQSRIPTCSRKRATTGNWWATRPVSRVGFIYEDSAPRQLYAYEIAIDSSCISQLEQQFRCLRFSSLRSMASESLRLILFDESADAFSVALWDKGMFGLNYPDQVDAAKTNWNNNLPVNPLRESDGFSINQWFGHGYKGFPPKSGDFMVLPSGGKYSGDVHCNRYGSRTRNPNITTPLPQYACDVSQDWKTHPLIYRL